ncbi:MAG: DUF4040 domain-containing protein [Lachnospiraceae bacterium]|nr:DUF4040 domain-containing protein [Lachnospiraceae bacterium]
MIQIFLVFWLISALLIIIDKQLVHLIIHLGIFSMISSVCFFLLAAPDVALAEAVVSVFTTIIFIVCFEKYYSLVDVSVVKDSKGKIWRKLLPIGFCALLAVMFLMFIPDVPASIYLKDKYITMFAEDIGGENAVTAIYLGYRVYDTLFEALMLLVSIAAIIHLSWHEGKAQIEEQGESGMGNYRIASATIRIIVPVLVLFSFYLMVNGHISPGGGFQGGAVIAVLFICRYIIYHLHDVKIDRIIILEKLVFVLIAVVVIYFIFLGAGSWLSLPGEVYLLIMNLLIGVKVACGLLVMFYRFVIYERK